MGYNQYKVRHDTVTKAVHSNSYKKYEIACSNKWYRHQPERVIENKHASFLWDYNTRTDRVIRDHLPDLKLIDKTKNKTLLMDILVP